MSSMTASFKSLRLSQADYDRHVSRSKYPDDTLNFNKNSPKLKIVAEKEEVTKILRKSSGVAGQDWILVPYDDKADTMKRIMQRVEKIIRIPKKHWSLAGDSTIFWSHKSIAGFDYFKQPNTRPIEVILLPASDEDEWIVANRKIGRWKRFPHEAPPVSELPANPRARAQALFPLLDTTDSPHWAEYIEHRQAAEARVNEVFETLDDLEDAAYWKMIRDATLESIYGEDDLTEEECKKIADAVTNVRLETTGDGDEAIQDADVTTRIHSLVAPKSVDMHLRFHNYAGWHVVHSFYSLGFRINKVPMSPRENPPSGSHGVDRLHTGQGWKTFGWFYLDEQRSDHSACPVSARDLKQVREVLFGPVEKGKLGERVSLRGTAKLMLASVGIAFGIALDEEDKTENGDGRKRSDEARLELAAQKPGISAAHLRKICGIPPLEDDDTEDLSVEQTALLDPSRRDGEYNADGEDFEGSASDSEGQEYITIYR